MKCPRCQETLAMADRKGIEIDYCPSCRGVWLDQGELDKIIERTVSSDYSSEYSSPRLDYREKPQYEERREREKASKYYEGGRYKKKKKGHFLEEVFDIFD